MIEFIEEGHIYLIDGIITPSATQLLRTLFPTKYKDIPLSILNKAAEHGTAVHKAIENYEHKKEQKLSLMVEIALEEYIRLRDKNSIEVIDQENKVHYNQVYAGTYDMLATVKGKIALIDLKTTYTLDKEYLSWQLSLYNYAIENMKLLPEKIEKFYCIWIPKEGVSKLVEIEKKQNSEIRELINFFKNTNYWYSQDGKISIEDMTTMHIINVKNRIEKKLQLIKTKEDEILEKFGKINDVEEFEDTETLIRKAQTEKILKQFIKRFELELESRQKHKIG